MLKNLIAMLGICILMIIAILNYLGPDLNENRLYRRWTRIIIIVILCIMTYNAISSL